MPPLMQMMRSLLCLLFFIFSVAYAAEDPTTHPSQTFDGAREQILSGHRSEALSILRSIYFSKRDPKSQALIESYSTQFLTQESEGLFFQAVTLIGNRKWTEAKERLDQANAKDPEQILILLRLAQVEMALGKKDLAEVSLKSALKVNPFHRDSKLLLATLKAETDEEKEALRMLEAYRAYLFEVPALMNVYLKLLIKLEKKAEIIVVKKRLMASKNISVLTWFGLSKYTSLSAEEMKLAKPILEKCIREAEKCNETAEQEFKRSQYLWMPVEDLPTLLKDVGSPSS